ncbi:molecular chaperone DnaJ [Paenibacillus darwinianus]|uniref:Molecular chaperone DnaJ n=1 Tax=Paenibacillus darwinianus TaxID=1380763 RepID=A0A9W5S331_9BACL|nr:DnaJ family domain-containing protein [Paenibacillus darwinianus]EXX85075.1 molecular chaperone DnaJ [Paenibacillus darwinianus]EXX90482.1 molecular chaperone DnaJ [Paenibacillus darwinianus]EXX91127.1 molecular chaperone DnaJ [Paenibacillus darwinianus]
MVFFARIAEERIKEALARGELSHLPGKGKPLELEDLSHVPEDLRNGYRMLKNAGLVPEEVHLAKETVALEDLIRMSRNDGERGTLTKRLTEKQLRLRMLIEQRGISDTRAFMQYEDRIRNKIEEESEDV